MYEVKTFRGDMVAYKLTNYLTINYITKDRIINIHYGVDVNGKQYIQLIYTSNNY